MTKKIKKIISINNDFYIVNREKNIYKYTNEKTNEVITLNAKKVINEYITKKKLFIDKPLFKNYALHKQYIYDEKRILSNAYYVFCLNKINQKIDVLNDEVVENLNTFFNAISEKNVSQYRYSKYANTSRQKISQLYLYETTDNLLENSKLSLQMLDKLKLANSKMLSSN